MLKKYILALFSLCVSSVAVSQQNPLLEKYRSMAVEYSHDLKAADKNIAVSLELEKAAQKDLYPKLSGGANFQYTGNPLQLTLDLPSMGNPVTFEGKRHEIRCFRLPAATHIYGRTLAGDHTDGQVQA